MDIIGPEVHSQRLSDGTRLDADVWRPAGAGTWPVLLQRQAYGRRIACTMCYAHPAWYAAQGYVVVVQDIRGRGTSEGVFTPGLHEAQDGYEAVEWAAALPWSNGRVGMYGFSYQAYAQFLAAKADPPSLAAIAPAMGPWSPESDWVYDQGGALRLTDTLSWGFQTAAETARRRSDAAAYALLQQAAAHPPVEGPISAWPALARTEGHLPQWLSHPLGDAFWRALDAEGAQNVITRRRIPVLIVAGWYDLFLRASFKAWDKIGADLAQLVVGPWAHFPWGRHCGGQDFGPEAALDTDQLHIDFFDRALKGKGDAAESRAFDIGAKTWRKLDPELSLRPLWLAQTGASPIGRAAQCPTAGVLQDTAPIAAGTDYLVHDPWRPAPAAPLAHGPQDRAALDLRGDVMTFTSAPLATEALYSGFGQVHLVIESDRPSWDVAVTLSRVLPQGQALPLAEACCHMPAPAARDVLLTLSPAMAQLHCGERLRLSIAASDFPHHPINPGTGEAPPRADRTQALVTTLALRLGPELPAQLQLPLALPLSFAPDLVLCP